MRTLLLFTGLATATTAALDRAARAEDEWGAAVERLLVAASAPAEPGPNAQISMLIGEEEFASGIHQRKEQKERTRRLLAGLPLHPSAENAPVWVRMKE